MATCPNINLDSWKTLVDARGEEIAYYLWDKYDGSIPEVEFTISADISTKIENELGESYWKDAYTNKRLSNVEEFTSVKIPGVQNKFAPDFYNVYHGTNTYQLDDDGNLILAPSKNFEDRTTSISFTQIPVVAQDYMLRKDGNVIIKIKNEALGDNYDVESAEEIAVNGNKPFVVPKGQYEIMNVPTLAEKMREKYAREVDERVQTLRETASSDIDLLNSVYSDRINADNYAEIQEYERGTEGGDIVPDWYVPDEYLSSRAARKLYDTIKDKINKTFIVNGLAEKILNIIRKGGNRIDVNGQYLDNLSTYGNRYSPHSGSLFDFLLNEINADKATREAIVNDIKKIVDNNQQLAIDFYNSEEQVAKREEAKRRDEENLKNFKNIIQENDFNDLPFQLRGKTETSKASPKTIALLKQLIKAIGVDIKQVKNITVNGQKMDANGAAMLMQRIIQVVEGKEAQALPEEAMHFVVEIIKQTNPALYKKLLGEVNNYRLTSQVFAEYSKLPGYQTKDGKPDVAKIKDEAIAKILTETVINQNEGSTEKPENLAKAQSWWDAIVDWFKNLFAKSGFDQLAMDVLSGKISGTAEDIRAAEDAVFFQISPQERTINKIKEVSSRIEKRDDGYYIDGKKINRRVTDFVNDWYSRRFNNNELTKSEFQTAVDDLKAEKGTAGHKDIEYAFYTLVDENGLLRTTPLDDSGYVSQLNPNNRDMYDLLKANLAERLKSLDKNGKTKFLSEITVYDAKRGLAGTIDFVAIDEDGKTSVLDWKFMDINVEKATDVPWYKVNAWNTQMEQYVQILEQVYGVKRKDFVQTRMIPIQAIYSKGNAKQNILPELLNVRIGDVNVQNIKDDFLIPVGLESEKTGDPLIDSYLEKLNALYRKLSEKKVLPSERLNKNEQLNALFTAIRQLQMVRNIKPIIYQAKILNKQIQQTIDTFNTKFAGQDPKSFTDREITDFAQTIETAQEALDIYVDLYSTLKSVFGATPTEEQEKILTDLNKASDKAKDFQFALNNISNKFVDEIIAKSVGVEGILTPEKTVKGFTRLFATTANLQITSIGALYRKANKAFALAGFDTLSENKKLQELKKNYDAWARSKGLANKNYFDIIKKKDSNELIDEFNPEFYKELKKHVQDKDYQWIRENIDVDAYRKFLDEKLVEEIERIENKARLGTDEEIAAEIKREKFKAEQLMTTDDATAPGWLLYDFVKRFPKKEKWESAEWKKLTAKGNEAAKAFYDYIREKNEEYRQVGYINAATARVFLPFVRKSLMEKIVTGGKTKLMDQFIRDISIDEGDLGYGQIDPLTGRPVDKIPKYFIREVEGELSTDLFRTMALYNEAAIKYKYLSEIEDQVRAIVKLERNKKAIQTSIFSTPVMEDGKPKLVKHNDDNAQLVEDMMKAIIYGQKYLESESFDQVLGTMGQWGETLNKKLGVNIFPEGLSGRQLSVNKIIHQLNTNFQITTLGLNPLSATSNFFGGNAQSIINAGTYFTKTDYLASEGMVLQRKFIGTDKKLLIGALEYFLPLTENYNREIAKKLSLNKLSQENIQDFLMILMRESDLHVQTANFYAFLNNTIVQDGKVVNAREFLRAQPKYADRYKGTSEERKALEKEFEKEVKQLVEEKGVLKVAKIENNEFVIPGVDRKDDSVVELRRKVQQISKDALGNLSEDDQRKINMTVYGKSFMVFKNWIPRLVDVRFGNLKYNWASDAYEWGRTRTLFRFLYEDTSGAFSSLKSAILGNDERYIQQIRKLYEKKKADYEKDTGKELKMDEAMFIDLVRQNIRNQAYDLMFYMTLWALVAGLKALAPDDEDETVRNQYKFLMRASDKLFDEIGFFYSPTGGVFQTISKGIFPSITLLDNAEKTFSNFMMENYYIATGDEEMAEKNFVIKYAMKTFPFTNQMTNYLPMFYPDLAKDLGIKVQSNYGIR